MISADVKHQIVAAMKAHDTVRLRTLKMLSSELHNEFIAKQHELSETEELTVVAREAKKRQDSAEAYNSVGKTDRANEETRELAILQEFLPAQLSVEVLEKAVDKAISETNAQSVADLGRVIGATKAEVGMSADGAAIAQIAKTKLSK
ncbi:GatB/YqeY domain-containing protein [Candidatus Microgenomates bacterium]|nr:MAG: GatB/YqeY domain-containing protein [Candidatus Microgenomates bacterium]